MTNWSEPFIPTKTGQGPEGVSNETHEIKFLQNYGRHSEWMTADPPLWIKNVKYRYRPRATTPSGADVSAFAMAIQHGDEEHRKWLMDAARAWENGEILPEPSGKGTTASKPSGADGSAYYDLTIKGVTISCNDVIDALGLNFNSGNEFKAIWRDGRKPGVDRRYDLEKRVYFATRELERFKEDKQDD